jgi:hypothetical protein
MSFSTVIAQTDLFAGGSVRFPTKAGWLEQFVPELLAFPGRYDDQVDALTQGLAWGREAWAKRGSQGYVIGHNWSMGFERISNLVVSSRPLSLNVSGYDGIMHWATT